MGEGYAALQRGGMDTCIGGWGSLMFRLFWAQMALPTLVPFKALDRNETSNYQSTDDFENMGYCF
jgi:hypothetical protein